MRYERYRKTGIPWLPEVPEGWEMVRFKNVLRERVEKSDTGLEEPLSMSQRFGIVPTRDMDVVPNAASSYIGAKKVYVGDIVFNKLKAHLGVFAISSYDGLVSPDYAVYTSMGVANRKFLEYLFHTPLYITEFRRKSTGIAIGLTRLYSKDLFSIYGIFPPLALQDTIVSFLDSKCGKIDRLVAAKEKEVALLKELKQSMIAEAVTRGVDHKSLKVPTGVFWQPRMPIGWSVKKCRHVLQKLSRPRPQDAELLVCTNKGTVNKRGDAKIGLVSDDETIYQGVAAGDLLIHGMDTWHGAIAVSTFDGMCTPVVHVCDSAENKVFVAYCFQNMARGKLFKLISNGVRQNTSDFRSWEKVARLPLVLPSRDEQDRIVAYIEARAAKIDAAVGKLEAEVAALKEYRERLVADVVTGQRKVA